MNGFILQEEEQNILVLRLNRPPDNFIKLPVLEQLHGVIDSMSLRNDYEGVIIASAIDDIFTSGHEVVDIADGHNERKLKKALSSVAEVLLTIQRLPLPTLSLINGHCVGFGLELALATDFRIAVDEEINIGFPDVRLGTFPPFGGIYRLVKLVGETRAKELLLKGKLLGPRSALEAGLIDAIVSKESLFEEGIKLLKGFSKNAPLAMTAAKRSIVDSTLKDFMAVVREDIEDYTTIVSSEDYAEGKNALQEGRLPTYKKR
ncbi:MAG: enoyl-CoA hydratase/isomerase family protein [Deltaproteobacteria bacterium]|nr:enoyl-CoA hydratase/isomerase family protein [Deltaproteobacteria bacterium]MCL5277436.1 enoyl-CoA hydratase/isomerase family protein [Deltaproteobacteria bacterium]